MSKNNINTDSLAAEDKQQSVNDEPVAVVGIGCRFPGQVNNPADFWELLVQQKDVIQEVPAARFDVNLIYDPTPGTPGKTCSRWGGFIEDIEQFDASFFGISPREAARMDPQQRLLLEATWDALDDAGQAPTQLSGSQTGIFVGVSTVDYEDLQLFGTDAGNIDIYALIGGGRHTLPGRLSYALNVTGPSVAVDTACSSALVAVHMACQSLRHKECDQAIVAGANLVLIPEITIGFSQAQALSPDGRCKFGDARANGFVRSDGIGVVVLKPLARAQADGDPVYAVILGSAVNNDGRTSGLLTVPSQPSQEALWQHACRSAGVMPGDVAYVEAHGTGTAVGDPVELRALGRVRQQARTDDKPLLVGSVKTNIGHTESAAGIAGLIKVALSLKQGMIPASLHYETPNPQVPWDALPLQVVTEAQPWPETGYGRRLAGVSAFGISGTNAHVVLAAAPEQAPMPSASVADPARQPHIFALSAQTPLALQEMAQRYQAYLAQEAGATTALTDLCYSAAVRRAHYDYRRAWVVNGREDLLSHVQALTTEALTNVPPRPGKLVFVFPGQGSQWAAMGKGLLETEPVFRDIIMACDQAMRPYVGWSLLAWLEEGKALDEVDVIQPAIFAMQAALATLWRSWGITPDAVVGQSMGEIAAAYVAGILSLADAVKIVCRRSQLVKSARRKQGSMAVVGLSMAEARQVLNGHEKQVSVAVSSSPRSTVLSGDRDALAHILQTVERQGIFCRWIDVDYASHSAHMDPLLPDLLHTLAHIQPQQATIPLYSTVTGSLSDNIVFDAAYWAQNLRNPVLFSEVVVQLLAGGHTTFLEISPHPIVLSALQQCGQHAAVKDALFIPSLRRSTPERLVLFESLARLYAAGYNVHWSQVYRHGRYLKLPLYAWQHTPYWTQAVSQHGMHHQAAYQPDEGPIHPLLGHYVRTALPNETHLWQTRSNTTQLPYMHDHQVRGNVTMPATAYLEMALAAAAQIWGAHPVILEDIVLHEALVLAAEGGPWIQTAVVVDQPGTASFRVYAWQSDKTWQPHGSARLYQADQPSPTARVRLADIEAHYTDTVSAADHYQAMQAVGIHYGPAFQGIQQIKKQAHEALAWVILPETVPNTDIYHVHPALLDACLQVILAVIPKGELFLPVGIEQLKLYAPLPRQVWSQVTLRPAEKKAATLVGDLRLLAEDGTMLAEVIGLRIRHIITSGKRTPFDNWLYHLVWDPMTRPLLTKTPTPGTWLLLMDREGVGDRMRQRLMDRGARCLTAYAGESYQVIDSSHYELRPGRPQDFKQLLADTAELAPFDGIIHLWGLTREDNLTAASLQAAQVTGCGAVLHLVQALAQQEMPTLPRLWLVTAGVQTAHEADPPSTLTQAPLWGLGRVISYEHPLLRCANVDLSISITDAEIEAFIDEITADVAENHLAFRHNNRYVGRLRPQPVHVTEQITQTLIVRPSLQPITLQIDKPGLIDDLRLHAAEPVEPGPDEVKIDVRAAGLNFSDVMKVMGIYPSMGQGPPPLGIECAGVVTAVGQHVDHVQVGDEVIAIAPHSFSSVTVAPAAYVAAKPAHLSFTDAATLPIAYLTAYYALCELGRLAPGERVLIHSAAGGVGMAAIQIAQQRGAQVFATAGTPEKRAYLRSLGIPVVMDSRSCSFAEEIRAHTKGEGVDVVLNSLTGTAVSHSLSLLRPGGRFLELAKRSMYEDGQLNLALLKRNIFFFAIDLDPNLLTGELCRYLSPIFQNVARSLSLGLWPALPARTFPLSAAKNAFQHMAQAQHVGKIILTGEEDAVPIEISRPAAQLIRPHGAYLITGGFGGLGLAIAQQLVDEGARFLLLAGRRGPSAEALAIVQQMEAQGVQIIKALGDITDEEAVAQILDQVHTADLSLYGVVHAAGVLDDGILTQLNQERFARVMAPKLQGAWNLHRLTQHEPLDFFVMFSSAASLLGSPGQANYSAANAFMDALAHYRQAHGLPGLSINWGPWSEVGLAAHPDRGQRLAFRGMESMTPAQGTAVFAHLLRQSAAQVGVMPMAWARWQQFYPDVSRLPWLSSVLSSSNGGTPTGPVSLSHAALHAMSAPERQQTVRSFIKEQVAQVLGLAATAVDEHKPLIYLGMDSLMAVELRNRLDRAVNISLSAADIISGYSVADVSAKVLALHTNGDLDVKASSPMENMELLLAHVEHLSDEEVRMLLEEGS